MGIEQAPTKIGRESAEGLRRSAAAEERRTEADKGSELAKGADRFEERSKSSDGKVRVKSSGTERNGDRSMTTSLTAIANFRSSSSHRDLDF